MISLMLATAVVGALGVLPDPKEIEASLWRDVLDRWFPACVDPQGGFRQRFGPAFEPQDDGVRSLVFQSRMVWVCASVAAQRPAFGTFARDGARYLRERFQDKASGALVWSLAPDGRPTTDERHAYGIAFAVYGLAATARLGGDKESLECAKRAFGYLERFHHDPVSGGYFEATDGQGQPKLDEKGEDSIGTPFGQKSQNTHLHLMEAFTELYRAWPDRLVRKRLEETLGLFTKELFAEPGHLVPFTRRDWTPVSKDTSYGHDIEAAHLMLDAAKALGHRDDPLVLRRARALADNVLAHGWDAESGGIYYGGDEGGPTQRMKNWWAEAEALLGFATLWKRTGDPRYARALSTTWTFIRDNQIDHAHGGWYEEVGRPEMPKGHAWKAAYHDGRALLFTARLLRA